MRLEGIYKNQSQLSIRLHCGTSIKGALDTLIKYKKPSGEKGQWSAVIVDEAKGIIAYNVPSTSTLNEAGPWVIWSYVTFADGRSAPGDPVTMLVKEEGM